MAFKVLVTGASTPAGRSMIEALQGEQVQLLVCDAPECACGLADVPAVQRYAIEGAEGPELVGDLLSLCVRNDVDVIVPMRHSEQLALGREHGTFERFGTRVWLAPIPVHITRSLARRVIQLGKRRRAADAVNALWHRVTGDRARA
jgi:hypothetical protein